jgi:sarcosine oxidase subunit gamma
MADVVIGAPGITIRDAAPASTFVVCGEAPALADACAALSAPQPQPCASSSGEEASVLWLGPDRLLVIGSVRIGDKLQGALAGHAHALVDVNASEVALELEGAAAERLLACGVMLDLDARVFPAGACVRTLFGKAPVLLWRRRADLFVMRAPRSYGAYLRGLLAEGARGLEPA